MKDHVKEGIPAFFAVDGPRGPRCYVNWGVALMYGGAIAVGGALYRTGATTWLAREVLPENLGPLAALGLVGLMAALFTEVVSNAAVIAVVLPIALPLATEVGLDPHALVWTVPLSAGFASSVVYS